jgi:hypothetical protein
VFNHVQKTKPDVAAAATRMAWTFPARPRALAVALKALNQNARQMPPWREHQALKFLQALTTYASDVQAEYQAQRPDKLGATVRNIIELSIWIQYCTASETNARTFWEDSARDALDQMKALQEMYTEANQISDPELAKIIDNMRSSALRDGFNDVDGRFTNVRDAAGTIGVSNVFRGLFKVCSKLAHPTSLVLNFDVPLRQLLDSLYFGGEHLCWRGVEEMEVFVKTHHPSLDLDRWMVAKA